MKKFEIGDILVEIGGPRKARIIAADPISEPKFTSAWQGDYVVEWIHFEKSPPWKTRPSEGLFEGRLGHKFYRITGKQLELYSILYENNK
jgi:hypothetical protein